MKVKFKIIYILYLFMVYSCSIEEKSQSTNSLLSVSVVNNQWTYISIGSGIVLGSCALGDSVQEKKWYGRLDWDIAICNGMIRTNSGTSGQGRGGIKSISDTKYHLDADTISIW